MCACNVVCVCVCAFCVVVSGVLCVCWCVSVCVGVYDVVCVCVCVCCVWRGLARGKHPCVGSKRFRVYVQKRLHVNRQNARMLNTCARGAGTHGGVLDVHTETF